MKNWFKKYSFDGFRCCCIGFQTSMCQIGCNGSYIIPVKNGDFRQFYLQWRCFDLEAFKSVSQNDIEFKFVKNAGSPQESEIDLSFLWESNQIISFCPYCGFRLAKLINRNRLDFDRLADKYSEFSDYFFGNGPSQNQIEGVSRSGPSGCAMLGINHHRVSHRFRVRTNPTPCA